MTRTAPHVCVVCNSPVQYVSTRGRPKWRCPVCGDLYGDDKVRGVRA